MNFQEVVTSLRRYTQSSLSCLYLMAGGFFLSKNRRLLYTICNHFNFEEESPECAKRPEALIPLMPFNDLPSNDASITLTELVSTDGNVSPLELIIIASLVRKINSKLSFEIGTFDGRTTLNMALNQAPSTEVVTLDLPSSDLEQVAKPLDEFDKKYILKNASGSRFAKRESPARIIQLYGDSAKFDFSNYKNKVDFMFIDGSHSYDFTINDSHIALSLVRPGGIVIWHDYDTPYWHGVTLALNHLYTQESEFKTLKHIKETSLCILQR